MKHQQFRHVLIIIHNLFEFINHISSASHFPSPSGVSCRGGDRAKKLVRLNDTFRWGLFPPFVSARHGRRWEETWPAVTRADSFMSDTFSLSSLLFFFYPTFDFVSFLFWFTHPSLYLTHLNHSPQFLSIPIPIWASHLIYTKYPSRLCCMNFLLAITAFSCQCTYYCWFSCHKLFLFLVFTAGSVVINVTLLKK